MTDNKNELVLPVLTTVSDADDSTKGWFSSDRVVVQPIKVSVLRANLDALATSISSMLVDVRKVGEFALQEVTVQVEVGAEGGVALVGTAKVSGKGALTLKFSK